MNTKTGTIICRVETGGTGFRAGLKEGDHILTVDSHPVRDPLEWRYLIAEESLEIELLRGEERITVPVEKDYDDEMGVRVSGPGFRKCNNRCVFCFIDQNPPGVRRALRFKDEDFRLSFLYGNYVTLTNTPQADLDRIVEQRLSPLYVSVHATELDLRRRILGNPRAPDLMPILRFLAEAGIELHAQVVLVPGLNTGPHLDRTVEDLAGLAPSLRTVGIVPVGLTRHREKLLLLRPFNPEEARTLIGWQKEVHARLLPRLGQRFVFLSDEFYLLAGKPVPAAAFYADFPQSGNGIGMTRQFLDRFRRGLPRLEKRVATGPPGKVTLDLVTSPLPWRFISRCLEVLKARIPNFSIVPHVVGNEWYGGGVTVSGLLVGSDIERTLRADRIKSHVVLLPPNVLNDDGLFLDGMSLQELQGRLGTRLLVGSYDLIESLEAACDTIQEASSVR